MNIRTRSAFGILALSSALASCSMGSKTELYTIEYYTDYDGIQYEAGKLDANSAQKVGEGYVAVNGTNKKARLTNFKAGVVADYENTRQTKLEGHAYTWDGWSGFYGDGAAIDLNNITGNCAVFAHFENTLETYGVTIENANSEAIFEWSDPSSKLDYGSNLGEALEAEFGSEEEAKEKLNVAYPLPKYYYQTYELVGYEDGDGNDYSIDEIFDIVVKKDLKLTAKFEHGEDLEYAVTFEYDDSCYGDSEKASLPKNKTVSYGSSIKDVVLPSYTHEHNVYAFEKWEGEYGEGAPNGIKGKPVDAEHILYDCVLSPVFRSSPETFAISFRSNDDSPIEEKTVSYGTLLEDAAPNAIEGLSESEAFTGLWSLNPNDLDKAKVVDPSTKIDHKMTLYPIIVSKSIDATGAKGDSFTYEYSLENGGYLLTKLIPSSTRENTALGETDLDLDSLPGAFKLVGIQKFGDGTDGYTSSLTEAVFPKSVQYVAPNAFKGNRQLEALDLPGLKKVDSFAFSQLYSLASFKLPSTLEFIGSRVFYGCSKLSKIEVDLTEEEFEKIEHSSEWNKIGESSLSPTYRA